MTSKPWMPLYIADYLADTSHLGALQSGAYLHLIMHYWQHGGLPENDAALARIARLNPAEWRRERETLAAFFHDGWKHKRIDAELADATAIISAKSEAGKAGAAARWHKNATASGTPIATAMADASNSQWQNDAPSPSPSQKTETRAGARSVVGEWEQEFAETFWPKYPNKVGKPAAQRAFVSARKKVALVSIMNGLQRYIDRKPADRPWLNPATFLNQERWADAPATANGQGREMTWEERAAAYRRSGHWPAFFPPIERIPKDLRHLFGDLFEGEQHGPPASH